MGNAAIDDTAGAAAFGVTPIGRMNSRPSWVALLVVAAVTAFVGGALGYGLHGSPAAAPLARPTSPPATATASPVPTFAAGQRVRCERLDPLECAVVLGAVQARAPETKLASLAIVDYAAYVGPGETLSPSGSRIFLVAFAFVMDGYVEQDFPIWRVSMLGGHLDVYPQNDPVALPDCFMLLMQYDGLIDQAPVVPTGGCH